MQICGSTAVLLQGSVGLSGTAVAMRQEAIKASYPCASSAASARSSVPWHRAACNQADRASRAIT